MQDEPLSDRNCLNCGAQLIGDQSSSFCPNCGAPLGSDAQASWDALPVPASQPVGAPALPAGVATTDAPPITDDPDRPRWGPVAGIGVWVASFAAIIIVPLIGIIVLYVAGQLSGAQMPTARDQLQAWLESPPSILVQVVSTLAAHLLTLVVCWAVVTQVGRRPFWSTLGSKWSIPARIVTPMFYMAVLILVLSATNWVQRVFLLSLIALPLINKPAVYKGMFFVAVVILTLGITSALSKLLPQTDETLFEKMLKTSREVRIAVAILAVVTAPLVEEVVYRGLLYSGLRKRMALGPSVAVVTILFAGVHFLQYWGAWASLAGLTLLSFTLTLIRAKTKSIIPCIAIHLLFNLIGATMILRGS